MAQPFKIIPDVNTAPTDSAKVNLLFRIGKITDSAHYTIRSLKLAEKINYESGMANALLELGRRYYFEGKEDVSLKFLISAIAIAEKSQNKNILKNSYLYIGFIYRPHEPYKAKEYYEKSLRIAEDTGDDVAASYALSAIGNIYEGIYDTTKTSIKTALEYYRRSLKIREQKGSPNEIASSLNETSRLCNDLGMYSLALTLKLKGLEIAEKTGDINNVVYLCNLLGYDYANRLKDYNKALVYQTKAFELAKTKAHNADVLFDITKSLANCYHGLGEYKKANDFFLLSYAYRDTAMAKTQKYDYNLSGIKLDLEKELEKEKLIVKDTAILREKTKAEKQKVYTNVFIAGFILVFGFVIAGFVANRKMKKLNLQLDSNNKKIQTAYQTLAISEAKFKQITETINDVFYLYNIEEKKYEYISPNCFAILGVTQNEFYNGQSAKVNVVKEDMPIVIDANQKIDSGIAYDIEYRVKLGNQKKWIAEKSSPIFDQNNKLVRNSGICRDITELKVNQELLSKKNRDITDSILYAKTIQDAILDSRYKISEKLADFFILSKPKEIVSGDFYFYKETKNGLIVAVADCTGHGVPAGFMSMLGNAFLNEIVNTKKVLTPAAILDQLRELVIKSLHQNSDHLTNKDGMDMALVYFENNNRYIQYSGAFNPLYIVRNSKLIEIESDLFPIGIHFNNELSPFTNHTIELEQGDALYIFSDGFSDQIGGTEQKRFGKKHMKDLLISIQAKTMVEQEQILTESFESWKGKSEQTDDVLVMGIRV